MPNTPDESPVVHIVDDDADLGDGLSSVLRAVGLNAKAYRSTQDFLRADDLGAPGCIVLDIRLPGTNGLDFQEELVGLGIGLPVILMTRHGDIPMSVRAMKAGAIDFLPKPFDNRDLLEAVRQAVTRDRRDRLPGAEAQAVRLRLDSLPAREREVLHLVVAGLLNKQIGHRLGV